MVIVVDDVDDVDESVMKETDSDVNIIIIVNHKSVTNIRI